MVKIAVTYTISGDYVKTETKTFDVSEKDYSDIKEMGKLALCMSRIMDKIFFDNIGKIKTSTGIIVEIIDFKKIA